MALLTHMRIRVSAEGVRRELGLGETTLRCCQNVLGVEEKGVNHVMDAQDFKLQNKYFQVSSLPILILV